MTHTDILVQIIADHGNVSVEEARFLFDRFRAEFPGPDYLGRELNEKERAAIIRTYHANRALMQWVAAVIESRKDDPLPRA